MIGFSKILPTGLGLLSFTNLKEAIEAIKEVENNYKKHAKAARNIAEEYFDSNKILSNLIEKATSS